MNELILIRHGEAEHHIKNLTGGWTDLSLTERGRTQAHRAAKRLGQMLHKKSHRFYSSDLKRAVETADIINEYTSVVPELREELRELNNGAAANLTRDKAREIRLPLTQPRIDWIPYLEAESWRMMHRRITAFLDLIKSEVDETALIVSHANAIVSIIHWWLEFSEDMISKVFFEIAPCSITRLTISPWGEKTISKLNDTGHLQYVD